MKNNQLIRKIVATFTALVVIFVTIPAQAISLELEETEETKENIVDSINESEQEIFIVEEDISKRGQFEKHYLCSDGTFISATYPEAIHYLDDNNKWQDVDQSLTYNSVSDMYTNDNADFAVSFSNKVSATNIVQIGKNEHLVSWGVYTTNKNNKELSKSTMSKSGISVNNSVEPVSKPSFAAIAEVKSSTVTTNENRSERLLSDQSSFALPKISSQISYANIFDGGQDVSLRYTVYHNKIEEDIVITQRGDIQSVSMNMDIGELIPVVNSDKSVDLVDASNNMQFHIGIPYMIDANHSVCNDIQVTADKNGTSCIVTYTPNEDWFESTDRVFPILLDPSVTTNDYVSNIEDTYVEQNTTANHSSEQYLYFTPNGANNNRRNIIVRVTKLPTIDPSMPIISAKLSLTAQYSPFSDISLKAKYFDLGFELSEYDYDFITNASYSYTTYSYLNKGSTRISFDFSPYIYEMYGDLEFDKENGFEYTGDFVIGYANDTDTTFSYPFYSTEYTTPSVRPVFTVKYGYSLPAGILDGNIYSFQNCASLSYMTVNGTQPSNNSNIYQIWNDENIATINQKFKLEYVPTSGGYLLRSMSSSSGNGKVADIQRAGGEIYSGKNVQIYSTPDPISQEWLIVPVDYDIFRIVPRSDMSLTLTAFGYEDGNNTGISATSAGNIFVQTFTVGDDFQEWYIYDNENNEISTNEFRAVIETGNYFLGNYYSGKYLHRDRNFVNGMSGKISSLGETTVKWQIFNLGDGYCTIQRSDMPHYYLAPSGTTSGSGIRVYSNFSETIPENYKWSIRNAFGGGCLIQHKASGFYLSGISSTSNPSSVCLYALNSSGTDAYKKQVWRVANEDYYVELGIDAFFNDIDIDVGETKNASVKNSLRSACWAGYSDFDYTITSGGSYVSYDATTHKFTGIKRGADTDIYPIIASVTATHKTTGLTDSFDIKVNNNAIIVIPGIFGSELYIGNDNPYFKSNTPIVSQDMLNNLAEIGGNISTAEIVALVGTYFLSPAIQTTTNLTAATFVNMFYDSIKCNNDGSSKYEVYTKEYVYVEPTYDADNNLIFTLPAGYDAQYYSPHAGLLDTYYDLVDALHSDSTITNQYNIEFFSYDWRLSNANSAEQLNTFINDKGYDKVVLVAHSMGGLVASGYMAIGNAQLSRVKEVYMLSSPLEGTPEVINVWANTDFSSLTPKKFEWLVTAIDVALSLMTMSSDPLQKLFGNYASIYQLFPTENYISLASTPYLIHSTSSSNETTCTTYATSMQVLSKCLPHFNTTLMAEAESFHADCRINNKHITHNADSTYMYSTECSTTTQLRCSETLFSTNIEVINNPEIGDGLVPNWSANIGRSGSYVVEYPEKNHMYVVQAGVPINDLILRMKG